MPRFATVEAQVLAVLAPQSFAATSIPFPTRASLQVEALLPRTDVIGRVDRSVDGPEPASKRHCSLLQLLVARCAGVRVDRVFLDDVVKTAVILFDICYALTI